MNARGKSTLLAGLFDRQGRASIAKKRTFLLLVRGLLPPIPDAPGLLPEGNFKEYGGTKNGKREKIRTLSAA